MAIQIQLSNGEVVFHQGSTGDRVLKIVAGEVEVLRELGGVSILLGHV